jgi:hypothetical protein
MMGQKDRPPPRERGDLEARIEMVMEILKYLGDDDRKHVLDGALLELSRL